MKQQRLSPTGRPRGGRAWSALAVAAMVAGSGLMISQPAVAAPPADASSSQTGDSWVVRGDDGYVQFTVPQSYVKNLAGGNPAVVSVQGTIGPNKAWSDLALDPSGDNYTATLGPLPAGLYYYQYTVAMTGSKPTLMFKNPDAPATVTSQPNWTTLFVPGPSVDWMSDTPNGGTLQPLTYNSSVTGKQREAYVWTPPGYDPQRTNPYPVLYLQDGQNQGDRDWADLGRAGQILDNLVLQRAMEPMVVVMGDANVADPQAELLDNIVPAARGAYNISDQAAQQALAGVESGADQALSVLVNDPGSFAYVGSFSSSYDATISADAGTAINAGTTLLRLYTGNTMDPAYNATVTLRDNLNKAGVTYEFDGVNPASGGTWDSWSANLRDFASRLFHQVSDHAMSAGHVELTGPHTLPAPGTTPTPWLDKDNIVTFETGTQYADASYVAVWGNWSPNGQWQRIPMTKTGNRWRVTVGPLEPRFYYYRFVVDGVDQKDTNNPGNPLVLDAPLYVAGDSSRLLGDVPAGKGGTLKTLDYQSKVAGQQRTAYVWTPPSYDPNRTEPYPVFYLNHGGGQSYADWVELGRAKQILDNLSVDGTLIPMVVVMGNGNVSDFQKELLDNIRPAVKASYNISTDPSQQAIAGLSMGSMNSLNTLYKFPGEFAYVGTFSGGVSVTPGKVDVNAINAGTTLLRVYTGDHTDFANGGVHAMMASFDKVGIKYEFAGETVGPHGFDTWQQNLIDFAPRLFRSQTRSTIPVEADIAAETPGALTMSIADFGDGVKLSAAVNAGDRLRSTGQLPSVTVTDSRTASQAGLSGWELAGQADTFANGSVNISPAHLGWTPRLQTTRAGLTPGAVVRTAMDDQLGLSVPGALATATSDGRFGSAELSATLNFEVPVGTPAGAYQGGLSITLFPVD